MRLPAAVCASLILLASATSLKADDPALTGFWLDSTPAPSQGFTENILWEVFPHGELDEHWQHTQPGQPVVLNSTSADVNTYPTLFTADNGRLTETEEDRSTRGGNYVMSPDKLKLIIKFDDTPFSFLFVKYGNIQSVKKWTSKVSDSGVEFRDAGGSDDSSSGITTRLSLGGPAHWVDPSIAGVWADAGPKAADSSQKISLWMVHPDGSSVLHIQNISPSQPLDLDGTSHDLQTIVQTLDAFGGGFVMASQDGTSKDTGTYALANNQLTLTFYKGGPPLVFTRYGSYNPNGSITKQSGAVF